MVIQLLTASWGRNELIAFIFTGRNQCSVAWMVKWMRSGNFCLVDLGVCNVCDLKTPSLEDATLGVMNGSGHPCLVIFITELLPRAHGEILKAVQVPEMICCCCRGDFAENSCYQAAWICKQGMDNKSVVFPTGAPIYPPCYSFLYISCGCTSCTKGAGHWNKRLLRI